ncbi:ABC transporter permease [Amycolatopsis magusensis]|uniref:Simple sugar transport system permease protein n=1 Tax=Amycolatopsis magusensis TaxID=882444 RepID=A0ABS4PV75_9PSEU|nr:ABC transporter permease [Amycolatopsis magusensis]MBP2183332.1 simple sugar transport system permease protein [Amycolatopsis magusensis]MDI5975457.1 ABC transporter permease [Amycolatopsis magusensis]
MSKYRLFWPAAALVALLLVNLWLSPSFFAIQIRDGHLYGTLIDILRFGAPLILVALGMTLVVATGGIDLSVGSVVAIGAAVACSQISTLTDQNAAGGVFGALGISLVLCLVLGLCNGFLVSVIGIQPIIATLILMVAGRGLAQLVTGGQIITVDSDPFRVLGGGYWFGLPAPILIALGMVAATALVVRRSALGLLVESVGGNPEASRLAGVRARGLLTLVYVFCGLCAGLAGLMISSNVSSADGNNAGLWIELDAILAVVIGGTLLSGGRFSLGGTVLGALLIQTLSTTVYTVGVPPESTLLVKALVVTVVCLVQSPAFRARLRRRKKPPAPAPADHEPKVEVPA